MAKSLHYHVQYHYFVQYVTIMCNHVLSTEHTSTPLFAVNYLSSNFINFLEYLYPPLILTTVFSVYSMVCLVQSVFCTILFVYTVNTVLVSV